MYKLICMSFDGDYQVERPVFGSIGEAWEYDNDLGSKWFFYPFHFVVSESGKTVIDAYGPLEWTKNKRVKTVQSIFAAAAVKPENQGLNSEDFMFAI